MLARNKDEDVHNLVMALTLAIFLGAAIACGPSLDLSYFFGVAAHSESLL